MQRADIVRRLREVAVEIAERELPPMEEAQVIAEMGLDSLSTLEMVGMMERELGIFLPTDELADIRTVGDLTDLIEKKLAAKA
jgi:acyl carrier protein